LRGGIKTGKEERLAEFHFFHIIPKLLQICRYPSQNNQEKNVSIKEEKT